MSGFSSASASSLPKDEGSKNLGGSAYFSWKVVNPISALDKSIKTIGYGCATQDTLKGTSKGAHIYRYAIKAKPKSSEWWLEFQEGVIVRPTAQNKFEVVRAQNAYPADQLRETILDSEQRWIKRDFEMDDLGKACVQDGLSSAVKTLETNHGEKFIQSAKRSR